MKIILLGLTSDDVGTSLREMQVTFGDALQSAECRSALAALQAQETAAAATAPPAGPEVDEAAHVIAHRAV